MMSNAVLRLLDTPLVAPRPLLQEASDLDGLGEENGLQALPTISEESHQLLNQFLLGAHGLGRASLVALRTQGEHVLRWAQVKHEPNRGSFDAFAAKLLQKKRAELVRGVGLANLLREFEDQKQRDLAGRGSSGLLAYLNLWRDRLGKLQLAYPAHWYVAGLREEELIDKLELELLDAVRRPELFSYHERSGEEATFRLLASRKDRLRRHRRIYEVVPGLQHEDLAESPPSPEHHLLEQEKDQQVEQLVGGQGMTMSRPQRAWLQAFRDDVAEHGLTKSGQLNEARVAKKLGKARSSATRGLQQIRNKLRSAGACEVLIP